uniref:pectinesterase n=1 Tax=Quercus lobata TaxID=97700 RepID=A0A7N2LM42_QUELO
MSSIEMDSSVKSFKGYGKEDETEEQAFKKKTRKPINKLSNDIPSKLTAITNDPKVKAALTVCEGLFEDAVDGLNDSISSMEVGSDDKLLFPAKINDIKTWLSTTIIDQETCLDSLQDLNSTVVDYMKIATKNSTEFTSNSLAIVAKILGLLADFNLPIHRRLLGFKESEGSDEFPTWVSHIDRRLLQEINVTAHEGKYVENVVMDKSKWNVLMYGDGKDKTIVSGSLNFVDGTPTLYVTKSHNNSSHNEISAAAHAILKNSRSSTLYPDLCYSAIATVPGATAQLASKKDVIEKSLNLTTQAVEQNFKAIKKLKKTKHLTKREKVDLNDCLETIDETLDELRDAVKDLHLYPTKKSLSQHADDLKTLISSAITNQETCLDGFSHDDADKHIRQALLAGQWPEWLSAGDRRLLQSSSLTPNVVVAADGSVDEMPKKTRFLTESGHCMVHGLKPMGKPTTWMRKTRFWTEPRHCMVHGLKPIGKPTTWMRKTRFWTEPRHCMVHGLKPMGKPTTWIRKTRFWTEPRPCMVHGLKPYGKTKLTWDEETSFGQKSKHCMGPRTQAYGEKTTYLELRKLGLDRNQGICMGPDSTYGETNIPG